MNRITKEEIIKKKLRTVYIAPYYNDRSLFHDPLDFCNVFLSRKAARQRVRETYGDVYDADDYIKALMIG